MDVCPVGRAYLLVQRSHFSKRVFRIVSRQYVERGEVFSANALLANDRTF